MASFGLSTSRAVGPVGPQHQSASPSCDVDFLFCSGTSLRTPSTDHQIELRTPPLSSDLVWPTAIPDELAKRAILERELEDILAKGAITRVHDENKLLFHSAFSLMPKFRMARGGPS